MGITTEDVTTSAPISDADKPARLLCTVVCSDGLRCGPDWPKCVNIVKCCQGGCFWRAWHSIPADKMLKREPVLDD